VALQHQQASKQVIEQTHLSGGQLPLQNLPPITLLNGAQKRCHIFHLITSKSLPPGWNKLSVEEQKAKKQVSKGTTLL